MEPTSSAQYESYKAKTLPILSEIREDVFSIGQWMPASHIGFSYCYLLKDSAGGFHVIDPGWDTEDNWERVVAALRDLGASPAEVRSITSTHLHPDHIGLADRIHSETGAPTQLHSAEQAAMKRRASERNGEAIAASLAEWQVPADRLADFSMLAGEQERVTGGTTAEHLLEDGESLDIPGFDLKVMLTRGHTAGHICLRDDERGLLYTGDHVIPTMHAGLGLGGSTPTNALADYLEALDLVARYDSYEALPGHGYRFRGIAERAGQSAEHHLKRSREAAAILAEGGDTGIWEVASRISWSAGWENLRGFFLFSALQQTAMHVDYAQNHLAARSHWAGA